MTTPTGKKITRTETPAVGTKVEAMPPDALERVVRATLLFHSSSPWDQAKAAEWNALLEPIIGEEPEATTRVLCNAARAVLVSR